jgi:hypothetical protein
MSIKTLLASACLALAAQAAVAAPIPLTLQAQGSTYTAGLSNQAGSPLVIHTKPGRFRDEFLIEFDGLARLNAWLETSADLSQWGRQGISFKRAGFRGIDGSELSFDVFDLAGTRFTSGFVDTFEAVGSFVFFVEGVAGNPDVPQSGNDARFNSYSYSGSINLEAVTELPEPASLALAGLALAGAGFASRRRAR